MTQLGGIRAQAARWFAETGWPHTSQEEWRFTNVAPIARTRFVDPQPASAEPPAWLDGAGLVFVNGRYAGPLSRNQPPLPVRVGPLAGANGLASGHLATIASYRSSPFVAHNTANFRDGALVHIPAGVSAEEPVFLVFLSVGGEQPAVSHPRVLAVAESGSRCSLVEAYVGRGDGYFTNAVTEIVACDGAVVEHCKLQLEDERAFHIATVEGRAGRQASIVSHSISLGGRLVRNDINLVLDEGASLGLNGLYVTGGAQHVDHHTRMEHAGPNGTSRELYKGILTGRSSAVFNGGVVVRREAQLTNSMQSNRNLLLSAGAVIHTKPELQIHADNVRCTHGATIGRLDADSLFYLRSRGIPSDLARNLLTQAFAREILDGIRSGPLRAALERLVWEKLA